MFKHTYWDGESYLTLLNPDYRRYGSHPTLGIDIMFDRALEIEQEAEYRDRLLNAAETGDYDRYEAMLIGII